MAFSHGKGAKVYVNGRDLTTYLRKISGAAANPVADASVFGLTAKTYLPGPEDATLSAEGLFDGTAQAIADILSDALGVNPSIWTWFPAGAAAIGDDGIGVSAIETTYEVETPLDNIVSITAEVQSTVGLEAVDLLRVLAAATTTGSDSSLDNTAASTSGGAAYLHVTAVSGTNPTLDVIVEDSADNAVWTTLATFTQATAAGTAQRVAVTGAVKRYTRATRTIGGTSTPTFTFTVAFNRK